MASNREWFEWARARVTELMSYVHAAESAVTLASSGEEMQDLFETAMHLRRTDYANAEGEELVLDVSLLFNVGHAAKQKPAWLAIAGTGVKPDCEVWFEPSSPETLRKYGLLLTNNALARCLSGDDAVKEGVYKVAHTAFEYFGKSRIVWPDRWVATACLLLGAASTNEQESMSWLDYALCLLREQPQTEVATLIKQAEILARIDNPGMFEMLKRHRKPKQLILGVGDLYLFNDLA